MLSLQRTDPVYNLELHLPTSEKLVLNLAKSQAEIRPIVGNSPRVFTLYLRLKFKPVFLLASDAGVGYLRQ